jgi:hypothetical protein
VKKQILMALAGLISVAACTNDITSSTNIQENINNNQSFISSTVKAQVVEVKLKNQNDLITLNVKGLDLFGYDAKRKIVKARVNSTQETFLNENKFTFQKVLEKNMVTNGLLPGYLTYNAMKQKLQSLVKQYPEISSLNDVGDTWEKSTGKSPDNDIWNLNISGKKTKEAKTAVLFLGGMHARELAPVEIMVKLIEHLLTQYGKDPVITKLIDTTDINIIPMVNVDGRKVVENGDNWHRKNTHGTGVDLNRNFDSYWNYKGLDVPSSWVNDLKDPNGQSYSGTSPASEPETQAIQNFLKTKKFNMVLDMHAYGEMFMWPVGYTTEPVPQNDVFKNMFNNSFKKIGYQGGSPAVLLYPTTGTTIDYPYVKHKIIGLGMEVGSSFRPSFTELEQMWTELKPNLVYILTQSHTQLNRK